MRYSHVHSPPAGVCAFRRPCAQLHVAHPITFHCRRRLVRMYMPSPLCVHYPSTCTRSKCHYIEKSFHICPYKKKAGCFCAFSLYYAGPIPIGLHRTFAQHVVCVVVASCCRLSNLEQIIKNKYKRTTFVFLYEDRLTTFAFYVCSHCFELARTCDDKTV